MSTAGCRRLVPMGIALVFAIRAAFFLLQCAASSATGFVNRWRSPYLRATSSISSGSSRRDAPPSLSSRMDVVIPVTLFALFVGLHRSCGGVRCRSTIHSSRKRSVRCWRTARTRRRTKPWRIHIQPRAARGPHQAAACRRQDRPARDLRLRNRPDGRRRRGRDRDVLAADGGQCGCASGPKVFRWQRAR